MESEEEDDDEQGGHSLIGFMFGNVDKDMRLQEDYLDKDVRGQLGALGSDVKHLGGDIFQAGPRLGNRAAGLQAQGQEKAANAQSYSDEEDMIDDESAPTAGPASSAPPPAPRLLVVAKQAAQASVEEDDYDADEDAQAHIQPSAPAVQPPAIIPTSAAQAAAAIQSGSKQVIDLMHDDKEEEEKQEENQEALPSGSALPVLAQLGTARILRFSEMFPPGAPQAAVRRRRRLAAAGPTGATVEEDAEDEANVLEAEPVAADSIEADAWASGTESEPEEGMAEQKVTPQDSTEGADAARLCVGGAAPAQRPPPAHNESEALRGGEALGKLANEHVEALRHASHAVDCAPSAAVTQMEWERDVEWGMQQLGSMTASSQSHPAKHGDAEGTGAAAHTSLQMHKSGKPDHATGLQPGAALSAIEGLTQGRFPELPARPEHPQCLRLEKAILMTLEDTAQMLHAEDGGEVQNVAQTYKALLLQWARSALMPNAALKDLLWLSDVTDLPEMLQKQGTCPLLLDLNDSRMMFEMLHGHSVAQLQHAPATVLPAKPKVVPVMAALIGSGEGAAQLARFNVSKDPLYSTRTRQKGVGLPSKHALPALALATLPVKLPSRELMHRPMCCFVPAASVQTQAKAVRIKLAGAGSQQTGSTIAFCSMAGPDALMQVFNDVDLAKTSAQRLWEQARRGKFVSAGNREPLFWLKHDPVRLLDADVNLKAARVPAEARVELAVAFTSIDLLPDSTANRVPDPNKGTPLQPPGAFTKKKDLTVAEAHLVLLEYLEERPLLLARPGMSMHLSTFYRKKDPSDSGHIKLMEGVDGEKWRTGRIEVLQPEDEEPFILASVKSGQTRTSVDTYMYKAGAFAHRPRSSDFLLVRSSAGALSVRRLTGSLVLGQQEPQMRIPAPKSKESKDILESRLVVHVFRELRRKQLKMDKGRGGGSATVSLAQLKRNFASLSNYEITSRLRDRCECHPLPGDLTGDLYVLRPGSHIPADGDLRKLLTPDMWCAHESMAAGQARLKETGLKHIAQLAQVHPDYLRLAYEQLPPSRDLERAFAALEKAVWGCPWELTDNFVSAMREFRGRLTLSGPGDPTGRGLGFSFWRDERKSLLEGTALQKKDAGQITGTNADLRKLSMKESMRILRGYGVTESEIKGLSRWQRISLVRDLANAKLQDGDSTVSARYARERKHSALELLEKSRHKARDIFERQAAALGEQEAAEDESDMSDTETTFTEGQSHAASAGERLREGGKPSAKKDSKKTTSTSVTEADEARELAEMRKGGFIMGKKRPVGKLEAKAGARRIRRTITFPLASGEQATRQVIITDPEKMALLNMLYGDPAGGFGRRTVKLGSAVVTLNPSPMPKVKKTGKRTSARCTACGEVGHTAKNKACPMYGRAADDMEEDLFESPVRRTTKSRRQAAVEATADAQVSGERSAARRSKNPETEDSEDDADEDMSLPTSPAAPTPAHLAEQPEVAALLQEKKPKKAPVKRAAKKSVASARKYLAQRVLSPAFNEMKRQHPQALAFFKKPVLLSQVPDYNLYVTKEDEMCFEVIERWLKEAKYSSASEFLTDIDRIVSNAVAYNSPYCGDQGHQNVIDAAMAMESAVRDELSYTPEKLEEAEERVRREDAASATAAQAVDLEEVQLEQAEDQSDFWVQCESCKKWRNLSKDVYNQTVNEIDPWYCFMNTGKDNAGCDAPDDYIESVEQSMEII